MKVGKKTSIMSQEKVGVSFTFLFLFPFLFFSFFLHQWVLLFIMLKMNVFVLCEWNEHVFLSFVKKYVKNGCSGYGKMIYCVKVGARMEKQNYDFKS